MLLLPVSSRPLLALLTAALGLPAAPAGLAQSALALSSTGTSRTITYANSSGFSLASNGTLLYSGPINALGSLQSDSSLRLEYDSRTIVVRSNDALIEQRMRPAQYPSNSLSPQLAQSRVVQSAPGEPVQLGYALIIPAITRLGASNSILRQEQVDGQSLSVFPRFSPSVFP